MSLRRMFLPLLIMIVLLSGCNMPVDDASMRTAVSETLAVMEGGEKSPPDSSAGPEATVVVGEDPAPIPAPDTPEPAGPGVLTIVFINGGDVWFVEEGGAPVQLTSSGFAEQVRLSSDGRYAVYVWHNASMDAYAVHGIELTTAGESTLITQSEMDGFYALEGALHHVPYQVEFIPGTHTILLNTRRTYEGPGLVLNNDLWSVNVEDGTRTMLLSSGLGGDFYISPSGSKLAIVLPTSIGFANIDGTGRSPDHLTFPSVITYSEYAYYPIPVWAPDESSIVVVIPPEDPFVSDTARVWQVPVSGAAVPIVDLTGFTYFRNAGRIAQIARDLSTVAFLRESAPNIYDLVIQPLDGSAESIYLFGGLFWVGWHPGSTQFVYRELPKNLFLGSLGVPTSGLGFGSYLRWVDADTYLYLDELTTTHRFSKVDLPGAPGEIAVISGNIFDYDFAR